MKSLHPHPSSQYMHTFVRSYSRLIRALANIQLWIYFFSHTSYWRVRTREKDCDSANWDGMTTIRNILLFGWAIVVFLLVSCCYIIAHIYTEHSERETKKRISSALNASLSVSLFLSLSRSVGRQHKQSHFIHKTDDIQGKSENYNSRYRNKNTPNWNHFKNTRFFFFIGFKMLLLLLLSFERVNMLHNRTIFYLVLFIFIHFIHLYSKICSLCLYLQFSVMAPWTLFST